MIKKPKRKKTEDPIKAELEILERGVQMALSDKFAQVYTDCEHNAELRARIISIIGKALGEVLDTFEYPTYWKRLLKRKDCPKYMQKIRTMTVNAYYPHLSLPEEHHWVSFTLGGEDDFETQA